MLIFWSFFFLYNKWVLNFVKSFFCNHWDYPMVFIFQFVNMVYHIDWFAYVEESLHPWDKLPLIMAYDPFQCVVAFCLLALYWGFLYLCSSVILTYSPLFCVVYVWFLVSGWLCPGRLSLEVFISLQFGGRVSEK